MSEFHNKELGHAVKELKKSQCFESNVSFPLMPLFFLLLLPPIFGCYVDMNKWAGIYLIIVFISVISVIALIWKYMNDKSKEYANNLIQRRPNERNSQES